MDKAPVVACLYETTASETSVEGARFMFKARLKVKEAHRNWEEELRTEAGVVCETIFAVKQAESETDTSDFSYEESSDEEGGSYPDYEEELSQKARRAHDRKKAAKRKLATRWKSRPARKKGKFSDRTSPQKASSADTSKKGHCGEATPVKQDSKVWLWLLRLLALED